VPTLHFVRHGETDWNRERRIQGVADVPLSPLGHEQARELAASLGTRRIGAIYSSDLRRALETAEPLAARLRLPVHATPALRERNFGAHEGRIAAEVAAELGKEAGTAWHGPDERHPGGESIREVYERVGAFLDELLEDPPAEEIVLVTSGGPIRVGTAHLAREAVETLVWRAVDNCSVTTLRA
jgi:broad specificity phosphatase PhoE